MLGAGWGVFSTCPSTTDDFAEFYEASYGRVVALVAAMVGDRHQAEDIAQEAFARALTRWPGSPATTCPRPGSGGSRCG